MTFCARSAAGDFLWLQFMLDYNARTFTAASINVIMSRGDAFHPNCGWYRRDGARKLTLAALLYRAIRSLNFLVGSVHEPYNFTAPE